MKKIYTKNQKNKTIPKHKTKHNRKKKKTIENFFLFIKNTLNNKLFDKREKRRKK